MIHFFKPARKYNENYRMLLDDLERTKNDLTIAYSNFENVIDPDLIDCYIYQVNAIQMRYKFLLTQAKQFEDSLY